MSDKDLHAILLEVMRELGKEHVDMEVRCALSRAIWEHLGKEVRR